MNARPSLAWRLFRRAMYAMLKRAAGRVLLSRSFGTTDGPSRWLRADFHRFDMLMQEDLVRLRPIAKLHKLPKLGNRIMVELAVMTIAAYRTLVAMGVDRTEARTAVADIGWIIYSGQLRFVSLPFRLTSRDPSKRLTHTIRLLLRFPFTPSGAPGYAVKSWQEGGDIFTHFTHCPPQTFVRDLMAELGNGGELRAFLESWCTYDWPGADIIAGDGMRNHYQRNSTLSKGDQFCDMCWKTSTSPNNRVGKGQQ